LKRKIIIIGAGIGGLSTGCYGQMNGYETEIFEMHNISGGLCTSWKRKDYKIDGSIGFLTGTSPDTNFYRVWNELGAVKNTTFVHHDEIIRINKRGKEFILYSDIDKLEKHMLETAPEDEKTIREFAKDVRKLISFDPPIDKFTFGEKMKMIRGVMPYISVLGKYRMSI
jgi:phytoene dehydrogenase-like protein